jgi:hypothetical protein
VAVVVLVLWLAAAIAGVTLLRAGGAARRLAAREPAHAGSRAPVPVRIGAVPLTADGRPPRGPHVRVARPAGDHALMEFCHPALAITGIACWFMFVLVHYRPFAWIALGILVVTMAVGLGWLTASRRSAGRQAKAAWNFPTRLVLLHGLVVALAIALTVLTAVSASHG